MNNSEIKRTIKESRIMQYEIAAKMGISEYTLCKWFRKELTAEQRLLCNEFVWGAEDENGVKLLTVDGGEFAPGSEIG